MKGDQQQPAYLAVNPMGKVPALKHGDVIVTEAAAICTYLADEFPHARLNVPVGDPRRGPYLKWLFFSPGCIEPAITDRAFPRQEEPRRSTLGYGDFDTVMNVVAQAVEPGPYLHGRAVHRRRRGGRLDAALGHDVQPSADPAGVHGLCRAAGAAARLAARHRA